MQTESFTINPSLNLQIFVYKWSPEAVIPVRGVVQIIHGMAEHCARYEGFAQQLTESGFIVYAEDHRGHGKTAVNEEEFGHLEGKSGWSDMVFDIHRVTTLIKKEYPSLPLFILGHSMGSFILRQFLYEYGEEIYGAILSGIGFEQNITLNVGIHLAKHEIVKNGSTSRSKFLNKLVFGRYNKRIPNNITEFDWLSNNAIEVDKYISDKACGFICTNGFFYNFFSGIKELQKRHNINKIPKSIPIYIIVGGDDPVGSYGKACSKLVKQYEKSKIKDISFKVYTNCRHELLNELNKDEVSKDIINWIEQKLIVLSN